jgi:hypothetical protein
MSVAQTMAFFVRKAKRCRATDALARGCDQGDFSI